MCAIIEGNKIEGQPRPATLCGGKENYEVLRRREVCEIRRTQKLCDREKRRGTVTKKRILYNVDSKAVVALAERREEPTVAEPVSRHGFSPP